MSQAVRGLITAALIYGVMQGSAAATDAPARYSRGPYLKPLVVRIVPLGTLHKVCARFGARQSNGCAILTKKRCYIYLNKNLAYYWRVGVLRHEQAHCRGWPASHPL